MNLLEVISSAWGWKGLEPKEVLESNPFGNLLVLDVQGRYWRIIPENWSCECIASSPDEYTKLRDDPSFLQDWEMASLVQIAVGLLGPLPEERRYCLKLPAPLGGKYDGANIGTAPLIELISFSGDGARQIDGSPDGSEVKIRITD